MKECNIRQGSSRYKEDNHAKAKLLSMQQCFAKGESAAFLLTNFKCSWAAQAIDNDAMPTMLACKDLEYCTAIDTSAERGLIGEEYVFR